MAETEGTEAERAEAEHAPFIGVAVKWVQLRPDIDPLHGTLSTDDRFAGISAADQAALEWALRLGALRGLPVTVAAVGPAPADTALRDALACGAQRAVRIDTGLDSDRQPPSSLVAVELAGVFAGAALVLCGDWSLDRGSASVPVYLAEAMGVAQACGLVTLEPSADGSSIAAERRLDGGRRQRLRITGPAVLSVEGATARLRRAPLHGVLSARTATIEVEHRPLPAHQDGVRVMRTAPFRPRARVLAGPSTELDPRTRVVQLTGAMSERTPPQKLVLDPESAAERIVEQLRAWGELE